MFPVKIIIDFIGLQSILEVEEIFISFLEIYKNFINCVDPLATYRM